MNNKLALALVLVLLGALVGTFAVFCSVYGGNQGSLALILFIAAVTCIIAGSIIGFTGLLDSTVRPMAETFSEDIQDDIEDIKEFRITGTQLMFVCTLVCTVIFTLLAIRFQKFEATWGIVPVWIPTVLAVAVITFLVSRTDWFSDRYSRTPGWVFLIPLIGMVLSTTLGITQTEDVKLLNFGDSTYQGGYTYYYQSNNMYIFDGNSGSSYSNISVPKCSGKGCGEAYLLIGLIILTVVLVIGSAFITHFWFFSGGIFISIMCILFVRDLLCREPRC